MPPDLAVPKAIFSVPIDPDRPLHLAISRNRRAFRTRRTYRVGSSALADRVGRSWFRKRLEHADHRVGMVLQRRAGHGVDAHADEAADQHVAREAGDARAREACRDRDLQVLVAFLAEGHDEFLLAAHVPGAGRRRAGQPARRDGLRAGGFRIHRDGIGRATGNGGARAKGQRERADGNQFHRNKSPEIPDFE